MHGEIVAEIPVLNEENVGKAGIPGARETAAGFLEHQSAAYWVIEALVQDHVPRRVVRHGAVARGVAARLLPGQGNLALQVRGDGHSVVENIGGAEIVEDAVGSGQDRAVLHGRPGRRVVAAVAVLEESAAARAGLIVVLAAHIVAVLVDPAGGVDEVHVHAVVGGAFAAGYAARHVGQSGVGRHQNGYRTHVGAVAGSQLLDLLETVSGVAQAAQCQAGIADLTHRVGIIHELGMREVEAGPDVAVAKNERSQDNTLGHDVVDAAAVHRLGHRFLGVDDHVVLGDVLVALPVVGVILLGLDSIHDLPHAVTGDNVVDGAIAAAAGECPFGRRQGHQAFSVVVEYRVLMVEVGVVRLAQHLVLVVGEAPDLVVAVVAGLEIARPDFHQVDVAVGHGAETGEDAVRGLHKERVPHLQGFHLIGQVLVLQFRDVAAAVAAGYGGRLLAGHVDR